MVEEPAQQKESREFRKAKRAAQLRKQAEEDEAEEKAAAEAEAAGEFKFNPTYPGSLLHLPLTDSHSLTTIHLPTYLPTYQSGPRRKRPRRSG